MFRLFCKSLLLQKKKTNVDKRHVFFYLQTQSLNSTSTANQHSPTVSYLVDKWGLPLDSAISASQKITIKSTDKSDSVIQLLQEYNFSQTQITNIINKTPRIILAHPVKTLKPKFEFLESMGLSKPEIAQMVSLRGQNFLWKSLRNQISPAFNIFKTFFPNNSDIISALRSWQGINGANLHNVVEPNIAILREHGVSEANIGKLLILQPMSITLKNDRLIEILRVVKDMKHHPHSQPFIVAVSVMGGMDKSVWEMKIEAYKSFGWSEEDVMAAFKLQPRCMITSEKKIRKLMDFYINVLGLRALDISKYPNLMMVSLEKRVIPRCSVLSFLVSNGLIERDINLMVELNQSKQLFDNKYVNRYQEMAPDVLKAYQGELGYPDLETLRTLLCSVD